MRLGRAVLLPLLLLVSPRIACATINIGLYDFGQGAALLDHLIVSHGLDAAYTRYSPSSFGPSAIFPRRTSGSCLPSAIRTTTGCASTRRSNPVLPSHPCCWPGGIPISTISRPKHPRPSC